MKTFIKLLPGIAWFGLILYLLTLPGNQLPQASWMDNIHADKLVHMFLFCVLTLLFFWGTVSVKLLLFSANTMLVIATTGLLYGIAMEYVQEYYIPNRSFDVGDIIADGIGSFFPLLFLKKLRSLLVKDFQK